MTNRKVLVVEPSNVYQSILQQLLEEHQCHSLFTKTGKEALELLELSDFDLICVAMELSDMSGSQVCQRIREMEGHNQRVPLVIITSNEKNATLEYALRAGATEIFHRNELDKLSSFLRQYAFSKGYGQHTVGNILYVEDSPAQSSLVIATLSQQGHSLAHFSRAEDALDAFNKSSYDLVLTDIFLKGSLTGLDIVKSIRKNESNNTIPILAMSGINDAQQKLELLRSGANDYVEKPVIQEELVVRTENLIATKKLLDTLQEQQRHLQDIAMKDQLTGLFNRHLLMESGPKIIKQSHRHQTALSLLVIDIDKFKLVNDQYGHAMGDTVLGSIGRTLLSHCREEDIACRYGGEEFVLLLAHCSLIDAERKAQTIRKAIEDSHPADLLVTASIGVSNLYLDDQADSIATLFSRADYGTYQAKAGGRNQVVVIKDNPA